MTLEWVVNDERRHAGRQGKLFPRGHCILDRYFARQVDPKGWSTVLATALGSGGNPSPAAIGRELLELSSSFYFRIVGDRHS
jgi:hypothetical protein